MELTKHTTTVFFKPVYTVKEKGAKKIRINGVPVSASQILSITDKRTNDRNGCIKKFSIDGSYIHLRIKNKAADYTIIGKVTAIYQPFHTRVVKQIFNSHNGQIPFNKILDSLKGGTEIDNVIERNLQFYIKATYEQLSKNKLTT